MRDKLKQLHTKVYSQDIEDMQALAKSDGLKAYVLYCRAVHEYVSKPEHARTIEAYRRKHESDLDA